MLAGLDLLYLSNSCSWLWKPDMIDTPLFLCMEIRNIRSWHLFDINFA